MELIRREEYLHLYHGKTKLASVWPRGFFLNLPFHKALEFEIGFRKYFSGLNLGFYWRRKCDHAGLGLDIDLGFVCVETQMYDGRHWNYKENRWYLPGEDDWADARIYADMGKFEEVGEVSIDVHKDKADSAKKRMKEILDAAGLTPVEEKSDEKSV